MADRTEGNGGAAQFRHAADDITRAGEEARGAAGQFVGEMRNAAQSLLDEQKGRAAETVHGVATALRRTAEQLHGEHAAIARYAEQAAARVDRFSDVVRERRLEDLVGDLDDFARRQPTLFLLGAVALGFVAGRFLAASAERRHEGEGFGRRPREWGTAGSGTYAGGMAGYGASPTGYGASPTGDGNVRYPSRQGSA